MIFLSLQLIVHLQRAQDELSEMRESKESVALTIEKFQDWETEIKVRKQRNKQTNKQAIEWTNKQTSKQSNEQKQTN